MAELKTKPNTASVAAFLSRIEDPGRRRDCKALDKLMRKVTGAKPKMWGDNVVGYGSYHYRYASGRQGDWFLAGFSPRKQNLTIYVMSGFGGHAALMQRLGKYRTGKACLYVNKLADLDLDVLQELVERSVAAKRAEG